MHCVGSVLAYSVHEQSVVDRVHCQLKVDQAVAAKLVLQEQRVVHRAHCQAVNLEAVKCIYIVLAYSIHKQSVVDWVHREFKIYYAVAAEYVGQEQRVVGCANWQVVKGEAVKCIVHTIADRIHEQRVVYRVHREFQSDNAVAAVDVKEVQRVVHRAHCQAVDLEAVQGVASVLADRIKDSHLVVWVNSQMQRHDAVAAIVRSELQRVEVLARQRVVHHEAVVGVALSFADRVEYIRQERVVNLQMQEHHAVAGRYRGYLK